MYMTQDDDKTPKRPRKKPVKKRVESHSEDSPGEDTEFKRKIQKALQANLADFAKKKNLSQKQVSVINSFIEEHLSCFILLGYTANGDPVSIVNAPTQKDSDSLGTLIQKFLAKYVDPPPGMLPPGY
jgi:hypothetical protein